MTATPTTVTFTVNANANSLAAGTYMATISFTNTINGQGNTTRTATLTVNARPTLQVTPASNIVAAGTRGGPFQPGAFAYSLATDSGSANFSITGLPSWLTASATAGVATTTPTAVTFTVNANANSLAVGTFTANIAFNNTTNGLGSQVRTATLTVNPKACKPASQVGDFNNDCNGDMLFRRADGTLALYLMNGFQVVAAQSIGLVVTEWALTGLGDFNGDGNSDMLFRRADGLLPLYLMNGFQILAAQPLGNVGPEWSICYAVPVPRC